MKSTEASCGRDSHSGLWERGLGVTSCWLIKWSHFHHSCETDHISALIRGSGWSPELLVVCCIENRLWFVLVIIAQLSVVIITSLCSLALPCELSLSVCSKLNSLCLCLLSALCVLNLSPYFGVFPFLLLQHQNSLLDSTRLHRLALHDSQFNIFLMFPFLGVSAASFHPVWNKLLPL